MKEYVFSVITAEDVQAYLKQKAEEGYVVVNFQPFSRKIKDTEDGTFETVGTYSALMERVVKPMDVGEKK